MMEVMINTAYKLMRPILYLDVLGWTLIDCLLSPFPGYPHLEIREDHQDGEEDVSNRRCVPQAQVLEFGEEVMHNGGCAIDRTSIRHYEYLVKNLITANNANDVHEQDYRSQ
jgi:hypothetical protein